MLGDLDARGDVVGVVRSVDAVDVHAVNEVAADAVDAYMLASIESALFLFS